MQSSPSIYEVASSAGVSVATVSRVLNGKGPVSEEARRRVLDAVESLGYVPHGAARSLSTRRTMNIGVLLPDVHGAFFSEIVRGIDLAARAAGYHILVSGSHSDLEETTAVLQALHGRIDGLILLTAGIGAEWLRRTLPRRLPAVLLYNSGADEEHDSIQIDNRRGARMATDHLLDLGHRRIALVRGPPGNTDAAERLRGFRDALAARGLEADPRLELPGDFGEESGFRAGERLARLAQPPTAVFAANDAMAIGCLAALRGRGLHVPEDVSLVGFDDIPIARYLTPALTTVQVPIAEIGGRALERLVAVIQGGREMAKQHDVVTPTLAVRASTAAVQEVVDRSRSRNRGRKGP
ncbi:MAG TPA: LacI family DNA-binding transcriptional regulator [Thermoanaerobaculia bacterium]